MVTPSQASRRPVYILSLVARGLSIKEEIVRATVERALGVRVRQHDDGSQPGMYDLDICYSDRTWGALEVTSDADERALDTLGTLSKRERDLWEPTQLRMSWGLHTQSHVSVKSLEADLEPSLVLFEANGMRMVDDYVIEEQAVARHLAGGKPNDDIVGAWSKLRAAGVIRAFAADAQRPVISVHPEMGGGSWDRNADVVSNWIEEFCAAPERADNIEKLSRVRDREAHLAVFVHLSNDLWSVWSAIEDRRNTGVLPMRTPLLPAPITTIWLFSTPAGDNSTALTWKIHDGWSRVPVVR